MSGKLAGVVVRSPENLTDELHEAVERQMTEGKTTFIKGELNR